MCQTKSKHHFFIFIYTGNVQTFTAPLSTTYRLEVWGAQGGNTPRATGGKGGYARGYINRSINNNLYVYIGGQGSAATTEILTSGGYNGGGGAKHNNSQPAYNGTGGGATHIATNARGELKNYKSNQSEVLLVAGGGGGSCDWQGVGEGEYANGGDGGGQNGSNGFTQKNNTSIDNPGTGGTQSTGGYAKGSPKETESYGAFGLGGYIQGIGCGSAGGGGGWYGGGGSYDNAGGGGGSGHIGGVSNGFMQNGVQSGNGKAFITWHPIL